jgi:hypothetical protein
LTEFKYKYKISYGEFIGVYMNIARFFLLFELMVVIFIVGCTRAADVKYFYGKWENNRSSGMMTVDLSAESWKATYSDSANSYTIEGLTWKPVVNDDPVTKDEYPKGYYVTGTSSQVNNISKLETGQQRTCAIYMSKDKKKFLRKQPNVQDGADFVFTKIE